MSCNNDCKSCLHSYKEENEVYCSVMDTTHEWYIGREDMQEWLDEGVIADPSICNWFKPRIMADDTPCCNEELSSW